MTGRKANVAINKATYKKSNAYIKAREDNEPVYLKQDFEPPVTLTLKELEVWQWLVDLFRATVNCRVSDADKHLMELYCRAKVAADEADEALKKDPRPYVIVVLGKDKDGTPRTTAKPNPAKKDRLENSQLCLRLFAELGLSPNARAKAGIAAANAKNELDIFKELMNRSDD